MSTPPKLVDTSKEVKIIVTGGMIVKCDNPGVPVIRRQ